MASLNGFLGLAASCRSSTKLRQNWTKSTEVGSNSSLPASA
jgi:hypothetical protein